MKFTAKQIAEVLNGEVYGNPDAEVSAFAKIEESKPETLTFLHNAKYEHYLYTTEASVCIVNKDYTPKKPVTPTLVKVDNAYLALTKLLEYYYEHTKTQKTGVEQPSFVASTATYGADVYIGAFAHIGDHVEIGNNVKIYPNVTVGDHSKIGDNTILYSGVQLYEHIVVGNNCIIHSNAVIGADGFGFAPDEKGVYKKIPQIGNVILEDDVEVGAATTIDRSTMGSTLIKKGVKLDNHVQIAHNVVIDEHTVIAAQTGVAGSTKVGKHSVIGGQVGIVGHIEIGDRVQIQAQSGVGKSVRDESALQGSPAFEYAAYNRSYVHFRNLPEIVNRLNEIEKKLKDNGKES